LIQKVSIDIADWTISLSAACSVSAEPFNEKPSLRGLFRLRTAGSRSIALLSLVMGPDHRRLIERFDLVDFFFLATGVCRAKANLQSLLRFGGIFSTCGNLCSVREQAV
jgi:hypothetical protein